jgi:transcriptional regulator with PAS, ATPase and Fis domain
LPEAPRYFTRESKRKRSGEDTAEDERLRKIIKAMLAQVNLTDEEAQIFKKAFLATEIAGIQIPQTYQQAIRDLRYGN